MLSSNKIPCFHGILLKVLIHNLFLPILSKDSQPPRTFLIRSLGPRFRGFVPETMSSASKWSPASARIRPATCFIGFGPDFQASILRLRLMRF